MYGYLYEQVLFGTDKRYFLDKTPRYYQIIPQIQHLFPDSRFIILLRNPLAVLCSILRTWVKGSWMLLHRYRRDLLMAPALLLEGINILDESCVVIHYEKFVRNPEVEMKELCRHLELRFVPDMIEYGKSDISSWSHGDQVGIHQHREPDPASTEKWMEDIENPQIWRLARDYLKFLGQNTVEEMGYACDDLVDTLVKCRPLSIRLAFTWPWWLLVHSLNLSEYGQVAEQRADQFIRSLNSNGIKATWQKISSEIGEGKGNALSKVE